MKKQSLKEDDFVVNDFLTINNFKFKEVYKTHIKFGEPYKYQEFVGTAKGKGVKGDLCLADNNIFGLSHDLSRDDILILNGIESLKNKDDKTRTLSKDGKKITMYIYSFPSIKEMEDMFGKLISIEQWK